MRTIFQLLLLIWLLFLSNQTIAAQFEASHLKSVVQKAIKRIKDVDKTKWAFELHSFENEEGEITDYTAAFNGALPEGQNWQLLTKDKKPATDKQKRAFVKQRNKDKKTFSIKLEQLITLDSLQLLDSTNEAITASFDVNIPKLGDDAIGKLKGTLIVSPKNHLLKQIIITNLDEFSPMTMTNIEQFKMVLTFTEVSGQVLPINAEMTMRGTFAGFMELNETSKDSYTNYQRLE
ncbi:MAG: hypothetical protein AAGJ17_10215 [Pseudomonadota bacterium]